jgi:glucuronoarabinoxylan endo-1,4-beta-xylanase
MMEMLKYIRYFFIYYIRCFKIYSLNISKYQLMKKFPWSISIIIFSFFLNSNLTEAQTVTIDFSNEKQSIRGFGGMNMPDWIGDLTPDQVDKAFGNQPGQIGFTILRVKVPNSTSLFNIQVPAAVRAKSHGAIVMASPWSPPPAMKTNNNIIGGRLEVSSYGDFANHLDSFADYMSSNGASLYAISLQNEPDVTVNYESCDWTPEEMINFLINHGQEFDSVKLIVAESFNFSRSQTDPILNNAEAESQVDIIGGHIYGGGLYDYPLARSKGKEVWMTEHLDTDTSWSAVLQTGKEIHDCMVANFNAYLWWYIRRFYGPIDESGNISKRGYVMSHYAKFVRPGFTRINATASSAPRIYVTAYKNDTNAVIVAVNRNSSSSILEFSLQNDTVDSFTKYTTSASKNMNNDGMITLSEGSFSTALDAQSITTFTTYTGNAGDIANSTPIADKAFMTRLSGNYPNPVVNLTTIEFTLGKAEYVNLAVMDITGRTILTLVNSRRQAGKHEAVFNGSKLGNGIYFYRLRAGEYSRTMSMIICR